MENQGCLCRNDLRFKWIHDLTTNELPRGVYEIASFQEKHPFPTQYLYRSYSAQKCPVTTLPSFDHELKHHFGNTAHLANIPPDLIASCLVTLTSVKLVFFLNATLSFGLI